MKTSKKTGKPASKQKKGSESAGKVRKMDPIRSKETKNLSFDDSEEDEDFDPDTMDDNFKGFDDFFESEDDDDE